MGGWGDYIGGFTTTMESWPNGCGFLSGEGLGWKTCIKDEPAGDCTLVEIWVARPEQPDQPHNVQANFYLKCGMCELTGRERAMLGIGFASLGLMAVPGAPVWVAVTGSVLGGTNIWLTILEIADRCNCEAYGDCGDGDSDGLPSPDMLQLLKKEDA